ncbi:Putative quercetin 2,3-dioxygenase [Halomicronema hongdechloris C2206]|uniref:Quercetin 2,3-dioxygenase n=1 Tax=Halomicronema hongdechloris C2206 TaxID=1641165 RepID=A0A1Z3HV38_9CYAN|nr:pirin family protein [Halomicronema hongdechloris]ASC74146.1 Putative quercetin 2,3-dioxygenase [Halomicronema hongdechloris C2206]
MITIRPANQRGAANFGWLDSRHTFSFGNYYDPNHMGFASLRVINEDKIQPSQGFGTHGHRDMEIITYVLEGALAHKDSIGNGSAITPGDVQRMSAGTGIRHSEFNHSATDPVHLLQIWILPEQTGLEPSYEQIRIPTEDKRGQLRLIGSRQGREGSITIHQDVDLYAAVLSQADAVEYELSPNRAAWLQVARGAVQLNGESLTAGDGAAIVDETSLVIASQAEDTEVVLFDMAV